MLLPLTRTARRCCNLLLVPQRANNLSCLQADALAIGKDSVSLRAENVPEYLIPHKTFSGGWCWRRLWFADLMACLPHRLDLLHLACHVLRIYHPQVYFVLPPLPLPAATALTLVQGRCSLPTQATAPPPRCCCPA